VEDLAHAMVVSRIEEAAEHWFTKKDPEGVTFEYPVTE
jgi:hypothetical protein